MSDMGWQNYIDERERAEWLQSLAVQRDESGAYPKYVIIDFEGNEIEDHTTAMDAFDAIDRMRDPLTEEDVAYERAQVSEAWQRMGGGGL